LNSIPEEEWKEIEQSLIDGLKEPSVEFTKKDWERYRTLVSNHAAQQKTL
jgi:hypothetical protein